MPRQRAVECHDLGRNGERALGGRMARPPSQSCRQVSPRKGITGADRVHHGGHRQDIERGNSGCASPATYPTRIGSASLVTMISACALTARRFSIASRGVAHPRSCRSSEKLAKTMSANPMAASSHRRALCRHATSLGDSPDGSSRSGICQFDGRRLVQTMIWTAGSALRALMSSASSLARSSVQARDVPDTTMWL